jgi:hypothetical protein
MSEDKINTLLTDIDNLFKQKFDDFIRIDPDVYSDYSLQDFEANLNKTNIK